MRLKDRGGTVGKGSKGFLSAAGLFVLAAGVTARATTVTFYFHAPNLSRSADNAGVQTYLNAQLLAQLGAGATVAVTGSKADHSYTGDGHVVGPGNGSTSLALGNSDGGVQNANANDNFIDNVSGITEIMMTFNFKSYGISFDFEIFPDRTCQTGVNCGVNQPDFSVVADGNLVFGKILGVQPGNPGAPYLHSPNSGSLNNEHAPQFLGQSGYIPLNGVTKLEFVDWPATIGVDNLKINNQVPEPASIVLLGSGLLVSMAMMRRRKQQ